MTRRYRIGRRTYLRTVGAAGVAAGLAGCLGSFGAGQGSNQELIPATAPGFPPFEIKQGGQLTGFDVDLLEAVVGQTSYTLADWKEFEFDSLIPALTSGKIDVIAAAMTITDQRKQTIAFSDPYYNSNQSIIVRQGEAGQYSQLSDLAGHVVGAQKGTTGQGVVQDQLVKPGLIKPDQYKAFDNYVLAVQALENGDVDAVVIDQPVGATFASQRNVEVAFVYQTGEQFGFGLRQDETDATNAINGGIETVKSDGTYQQLTNKWFGQG